MIQEYNLNGPKSFYFPYPVRYPSQLTVEVLPGGVLPASAYQVIGYGPTSTGVTIYYPTAPTNGTSTLRVSRIIPPERITVFTEDRGATAAALNAEFDNIYGSLQDYQNAVGAIVGDLTGKEYMFLTNDGEVTYWAHIGNLDELTALAAEAATIRDDIEIAAAQVETDKNAVTTLKNETATLKDDTQLLYDGVSDFYSDMLDLVKFPMLHVRDEKPNGTSGGTSVAGVQTRELNTVVINEITGASLSSNRVTLPAGKYIIYIRSPFYNLGAGRLILYDYTNYTIIILGSNHYAQSGHADEGDSIIFTKIMLAEEKIFEVKLWTASAADNGLGNPSSSGLGNEVYTEFIAIKIG